MNKYCCFWCPAKDYTDKTLDDVCPRCGRSYGFVRDYPPVGLRDYRATTFLGRGFYAAAYVAEGRLSRPYVLKISPTAFYPYFNKADFFDVEVKTHIELARHAVHVVNIVDALEETVVFSDPARTELPCFVTVLDYVDGLPLSRYLREQPALTPATVCQIAIDLIRIRSEFTGKLLNHNDLHDDNLIVETLRPGSRRAGAIDDSIIVKVIDLGSVSGDSKSGPQRLGDLQHIARHVNTLLARFLRNPGAVDDRDFRIALSLQGLVNGFLSSSAGQRMPQPEDIIGQIMDAYYHGSSPWRPWRRPVVLKGFSDHYNAQTLESWDVPRLLVDPDGRWLSRIAQPGPQIITGMRGCGKTMLLRALDIHARASQQESESDEDILRRVGDDKYVALFVSAQKLLDLRPQSLFKLEHRVARLFINYALQAVRGLLHLTDLRCDLCRPDAHKAIASSVSAFVPNAEHLLAALPSLEGLERALTKLLVLCIHEPERHEVRAAPAEAFPHLAASLCSTCSCLEASQVFYLLDDVSTRYLEIDRVGELVSSLLFQHPRCAFKFTSEWQTIELGLKSPGRENPVREGRDITVFDLGADVLGVMGSSRTTGKAFVLKVLHQRAKRSPAHPSMASPEEVLGDVPLEQVAREIALSTQTSEARKNVYRGASCLANVCVGDIGDVIRLYEEIVRHVGKPIRIPVPQGRQSECFRDFSSRRLYDLNRRKGEFKDYALGFAEAAHELLVRSGKLPPQCDSETGRLRQFSSIYVRITSEDESSRKQQIDRLRDLIDASVFVFAGGTPRTKTKDSNPTQQFILSYRKVYGLASFIGLADRDRFELSGNELAEWLERPSSTKTILLRNQIKSEVDVVGPIGDEVSEPADTMDTRGPAGSAPIDGGQGLLAFGAQRRVKECLEIQPGPMDITVRQVDAGEISQFGVQSVLSGLGFEDRTLASNAFLAQHIKSTTVHLVRYDNPGKSDEIVACWSHADATRFVHDYAQVMKGDVDMDGLVLVDVSGLPKPVIFNAVRHELATKGRVLVCHARAKRHYPLDEDLDRLLSSATEKNRTAFLEALAAVLTGEKGPYELVRLLPEGSDPSLARVLFAFASPKHERLFSLLDRREFDYIEVFAPEAGTNRAKVAGIAAEFVRQNFPRTTIDRAPTDDLRQLTKHLDARYLDLYARMGSNVEVGLTGSKMQAVAAAILSARRKVAQAWYVSPREFDVARFTSGVQDVRVFDIGIGEEMSGGQSM